MRIKNIIICLLLMGSFVQVQAQFTPTIEETEQEVPPEIGEAPEVKKTKYSFRRSFTDLYPHPKTAMYLSLGFPAGGQLYNKQYWKVPLVWAAYGGAIYLINYNQGFYRDLKQAVIDRLAGEQDQFPFVPSIEALRNFRDQARTDTERSYIALVFVHILSAGEAFVGAHLKTFDVSEDLSLQLKPVVIPYATGLLPAVGMSVTLSFY